MDYGSHPISSHHSGRETGCKTCCRLWRGWLGRCWSGVGKGQTDVYERSGAYFLAPPHLAHTPAQTHTSPVPGLLGLEMLAVAKATFNRGCRSTYHSKFVSLPLFQRGKQRTLGHNSCRRGFEEIATQEIRQERAELPGICMDTVQVCLPLTWCV